MKIEAKPAYVVYDYMDEGFYTVYYRNRSVGCADSEIVVQVAGALWYEQEPPEETPTPTPVATWIVPPSPTPRVTRSVETPVGSSNIDFHAAGNACHRLGRACAV